MKRRWPESQILSETIGSIPSYMTLSDSQVNGLVNSFFNIFSTMKNSLKLLGSTLALNFRVIKNTLTGDADKVKKAFDTFNKV